MTPEEAIVAHADRKLSRDATFRAFFDHSDWRTTTTGSAWSSAAAHQKESPPPKVTVCEHLDDVIAELDLRVPVFRIDPGSPMSLSIQTNQLEAFRRLARASQVERAMMAKHYQAVREYDGFRVPFHGQLGKGHQVVMQPSEHGELVSAFTADDAIEAFLEASSAADRASVKFMRIDGIGLFESALELKTGVMVNAHGPRKLVFAPRGCCDVLGIV